MRKGWTCADAYVLCHTPAFISQPWQFSEEPVKALRPSPFWSGFSPAATCGAPLRDVDSTKS